MQKMQIEKILEAEREAKERIASAERQAKSLLEEARAQRTTRLEHARAEALAEAESLVQQANADDAQERARIIEKAKAEANLFLATADRMGVAFAQQAARAIAGLEP